MLIKKLEEEILRDENGLAHLSSAMLNDEVEGYSNEYLIAYFSKIHFEAKQASEEAVEKFIKDFNQKNPNSEYGEPAYCGFAWVQVFDVKLNTRLGKKMKEYGFTKYWTKGSIYLWNPSEYHGQSMDVKEEGARAYAKVLNKYGFKAYMGSRPD